jgi:hypothetical protein
MPSHEPLGRDAVLLDELGLKPIRVSARNAGDGAHAVILDLGGRLNKTDARVTHRYLLSVPQTAELIANAVVAAQTADPEFAAELEQAIAVEQQRIADA